MNLFLIRIRIKKICGGSDETEKRVSILRSKTVAHYLVTIVYGQSGNRNNCLVKNSTKVDMVPPKGKNRAGTGLLSENDKRIGIQSINDIIQRQSFL